MKEVEKITNDWLRQKETDVKIQRVVTYLGADGLAHDLELHIRLLPGTVMDQIEDALILRDDSGAVIPGDASMSSRSMKLVQLSLELSKQEIDLLITHKPLNLINRIVEVCENINGQGTIRKAEESKNVEAEGGPTSD